MPTKKQLDFYEKNKSEFDYFFEARGRAYDLIYEGEILATDYVAGLRKSRFSEKKRFALQKVCLNPDSTSTVERYAKDFDLPWIILACRPKKKTISKNKIFPSEKDFPHGF